MGARDSLAAPGAAALNATAQSQEYEFRARDFERVRGLIDDRARIALRENKQNLVYSRLSKRLRTHAMASIAHYFDRLETDAQFRAAEEQELVNALTTNQTSFFREAHHFEALEEFLHTLPAGAAPRIWCAAASPGEEPYSIAMTMTVVAAGKPPGGRLATDIDTNVLASASHGIYWREAAARACGGSCLRVFFLRGTGDNEGMVRVRPELVQLIQFAPLNLLDEDWPLVRDYCARLDAIFCRNVMIYFDRKTQRAILHRIVQYLRPGGLLFVGHAENFTDCTESIRLRGKTVYQRQ